MSLSSRYLRRLTGLAATIVVTTALAGCGFTPLYGTDNSTANIPLSYAAPTTRADQIIYRELALGLGQTSNPDAPLVTITSSGYGRQIGRSASGLPTTTLEWTHTATAKVTEPDPLNPGTVKVIYSGEKSASATYTTNGQSLADQEAVKEAEVRAAKAVAQSLRLSIKAALSNR